jgi:hypothetical protein
MAKRRPAKKSATKKTQRPSALDLVREGAAADVRHMSTRDIERNVDRLQNDLEITNETIEDLRAQTSALTRSRSGLIAQIEGMLAVRLTRQ